MKKILLAVCTTIIFSSIAIACNDQVDEVIITRLYETTVNTKKMSQQEFFSKYCKDQTKIEACNKIAEKIRMENTKGETAKLGSK